jgi:hypothetical protein
MGYLQAKVGAEVAIEGSDGRDCFLIVLVAPAFFDLNVFSPKKNRF